MLTAQKNDSVFRIAVHVLIWLFLFLFPILLSSGEQHDYYRVLRFTIVPLCFHAILFYLNYLVLIGRFLFSKKMLLFIAINLLIISVFAWLVYHAKQYIGSISPPDPRNLAPRPPAVSFFIYKDFLSMLIPVVVSIAARSTEQWSINETEKKEIEKENLNSELQHLKYQLQPHFFFNSLNTIYALVERSPEQARETIHSLSKLMRYMLYDTDKDKNNLGEEIEFMTQYIGLMKLRISDKTKIKFDFPGGLQNKHIAPLLFVSLIENAFKHGISSTQPSEIAFSLQVNGDQITFRSKNTNFPKNNDDKSGSGIGLANLRKRLSLTYPGKHSFKTEIADTLFIASLEIDIST